jgi:hypothetical protein
LIALKIRYNDLTGMNNQDQVRTQVKQLIDHYFGGKVSTSYAASYQGATLSEYVHTAFKLLMPYIGERKSHQEIDAILSHYEDKINYE